MRSIDKQDELFVNDSRFDIGIKLFNSSQWYKSHDFFEDLWHETNGPARQTIQAFLQIAVAHLHLENGNKNGATILLGEALGRLKKESIPDLGIDLDRLQNLVEQRLSLLHKDCDPYKSEDPKLCKLSNKSSET
tara:strand:+ start:372 stop:773 length:402 start_codon:yes stop_codon:yes gene_type:complete